MDYKKSLVMNLRHDFDTTVKTNNYMYVNNEEKAITPAPTIKEQLSELSNRINQLAYIIGVPYAVIFEGELSLYPARKGGVKKISDKAVSYTVDLRPYRNDFAAVRFEASVPFDTEDLIRGVIVDDEGNIECECDNRYELHNRWTRLPITPKSRYLIASLPLENGKPEWLPQTVEFMSQGLAMDMTEITNELFCNISRLSSRIKELEKQNNNKLA